MFTLGYYFKTINGYVIIKFNEKSIFFLVLSGAEMRHKKIVKFLLLLLNDIFFIISNRAK